MGEEGASRSARSSFFTLGIEPSDYRLPHPLLGLRVVLVVRQAILRAFEILCERRDCPLATAKEDEITVALRAVLENDLRQSGEVDGFNRETFDKVERQHRAISFDGMKLSKEPDMMFSVRDDGRDNVISTEDGLVVECKPVDREHPPGTHYCDRGIQRFVDGDYAWAMQEGMMLGYARHGRTIAGDLLPVMAKDRSREKLKTDALPEPISERDRSDQTPGEALHFSLHRRGFSWRDGKGAASPITICHPWHACD